MRIDREFLMILQRINKALDVFERTGERSQFVNLLDQLFAFIDEYFSEEEKKDFKIERAKWLSRLNIKRKGT